MDDKKFKIGDAIKVNGSCGVIKNIWRAEWGGGMVYEIYFVKNIFRQQQPERIDAAIIKMEHASPFEIAEEMRIHQNKINDLVALFWKEV